MKAITNRALKFILVYNQLASDCWADTCNSSELMNLEGISYYRYQITQEIGKFQKRCSRKFREEGLKWSDVQEWTASVSDSLIPQITALKISITRNLSTFVSPKWHRMLSGMALSFALLQLSDAIMQEMHMKTQYDEARRLIGELAGRLPIEFWKDGNLLGGIDLGILNANVKRLCS